jgi:small subunit ribosomal protein S1
LAENDRGALVNGKVTSVESKEAQVQLADEVVATLRAGEISQAKVEDATTQLNVGDDIEVRIISVDRKKRNIQVSIKAVDSDVDATGQAQDYQPKTIGDLLKEQLKK